MEDWRGLDLDHPRLRPRTESRLLGRGQSADTGKRKWHFRFTPNDVHDWDATQVMVLIDREYRGVERTASA